jgi:AcrR family transcriptional regulator
VNVFIKIHSGTIPMREAQKQATRAKILMVAKAMLEETGYEKTTLRAIAGATGVATGSIFVHFANKEDLFYTAFYDDLQALMEKTLTAPPAETLAESLNTIVLTFFETFASRPALYSALLQLSLFAEGEWGKRFRRQVEVFGQGITQLYQAAIARGELAPQTQPQIATATFLSLYYFCLITLINQHFADLSTARNLFALMLTQHLQGLKYSPGEEQ